MNGGVVQQVGRPIDLYQNPANLFVAGFIDSPKMNTVPAETKGVGNDLVALVTSEGEELLRLPSEAIGPETGRRLTIAVRPQSLHPNPDGALCGGLDMVERLSNETVIAFRWGEKRRWLAALAGDHVLRRGDAVRLKAEATEFLLFDGSGSRRRLERLRCK